MTDRLPFVKPADWTDGQRAAVASDAPAVMIQGDLRSGKTTALLSRAIRMARAVDPEGSVFFIANTATGVQASRAMFQAVDVTERIEMTTPHELAARVLRMLGDSNWTLTHPDADRKRVSRILEAMGYKDLSGEPYDVWRELTKQAADDRDRTVSASFPLTDEEFAELRETYGAVLRRTRTLSRPHLVRRVVECLARVGESPLKPVHVIVDDAENLSPVELRFVRALDPETVTVAVNPNACIEASLGAVPSPVVDWVDSIDDRERVRLEAPTRTTPILEAANRLLNSESTSCSGADAGRSDASGEASIQMFSAPFGSAEQDRILGAIQEVMEAQDGGAADVAVMAPNRSLRGEMVRRLRESGLTVEVPGAPWHGQETILDILSYLFVLANPHDDAHLFRIINQPSRGIGRKTQARLRTYAAANDLSAWEAIERARSDGALSSRARRVLGDFREMVEPLVQHAREAPLADVARTVLADTELLTPVTRGHTREQIEREEQVERFLRDLPDGSGIDALKPFLDAVALGFSPLDSAANIRVATLREARDVTAGCVFVFALEEGLLPANHALRRGAFLEEERRRLAVAMSRAESLVILSWAQSRGTGRREEPTSRSRFWDVLGPLPIFHASIEDGDDYQASLRAKQASSRPSTQPTDEDAAAIQVGQRVEHPKLGIGTVEGVENNGDQHVATVTFDDRGTKTLNLRYAPLTLLDA